MEAMHALYNHNLMGYDKKNVASSGRCTNVLKKENRMKIE